MLPALFCLRFEMNDEEAEDGIQRAFSKQELAKVYERLVAGDESALEPWRRYFAVLAGYSAGKVVNNSEGHWHEGLFEERFHEAWLLIDEIGRNILSGKTRITGECENYGWSSIRHLMIACDKDDRGDGSTRSKEGWQGKRWKFTEVEVPVVTSSMTDILEEVYACCENDFDRKVVRLFIENGDDLEKVAQLAELAIEEVQHLRGIVAERLAQRMRNQGEPLTWLEKRAKTLKSTRKPRKQSPKQSNVWPADKPKGSKAKATKQAK